MTGTGRNLLLTAGLVVLLAIGAAILPGTGWVCGLGFVLGLVGVMLLRGNRWRSGALVAAALAVAAGLLNLFAALISPQAHGVGIVETLEPRDWSVADADLGYRPRPGTKIQATATWGSETIYKVTYTITPEGFRATPAAPPGADTYLFLGDSFMYGHGLADDQTLPAQFARLEDFKVKTALFAAPGYAPNQLVRAFETGRFDAFKTQKVKAVVTWIIPPHLGRVTGEGSWLASSPRYELDNTTPRFTGSFESWRWRHPVEGLAYLARERLPFLATIGLRQREAQQAALFTALVRRLQALARERLGAPLIVICSWPDETTLPRFDGLGPEAQARLVAILVDLRDGGIPVVAVNPLTLHRDPATIAIPHDGHPTAFTDGLIAEALQRRLTSILAAP